MSFKSLSGWVAVLLVAGPLLALAAEDAVAPKARRRAAANKMSTQAPASKPPPAPVAKPESAPPAPAEPPRSVSTPAPAEPPSPSPLQSLLHPRQPAAGQGEIDARVHLVGDVLLAFVELGVAVDLGLLPVGPGAVAVGGEFSAGACPRPAG